MEQKVVTTETRHYVYVAEDGKEFTSRYECREYEQKLYRESALKTIMTCGNLEGVVPPDGSEHLESNNYFWFYPRSERDIELLNKAYSPYDDIPIFNQEMVNGWLCVEVQEDGAWVTTLEDCVEHLTYVCLNLGYHVDVRED